MKPAPASSQLFDEETVEQTTRSIELIHQFLDELLENEELMDEIPSGWLVLLPDDDPELFEAHLAAGLAEVRRGENVHFRHV